MSSIYMKKAKKKKQFFKEIECRSSYKIPFVCINAEWHNILEFAECMNIAAFSIPQRFCLFFFRENETKACARFCKIYILILINTNIFKIGIWKGGGKRQGMDFYSFNFEIGHFLGLLQHLLKMHQFLKHL